MAAKPSIAEMLELSPAERILLVEEIWDSLLTDPTAVPITEAQRLELDARLAAHEERRDGGSTWEAVRGRLTQRS